MAINFPNQSRSYDPTRCAVRFWGYDSAMERSFFIAQDALKRIDADMPFEETAILNAFDSNSALIYATAAKVCSRGPKGSYDIIAADF
jgi:Protein of unknown function (DUF1488)